MIHPHLTVHYNSMIKQNFLKNQSIFIGQKYRITNNISIVSVIFDNRYQSKIFIVELNVKRIYCVYFIQTLSRSSLSIPIDYKTTFNGSSQSTI